jgi:hypothetical protein
LSRAYRPQACGDPHDISLQAVTSAKPAAPRLAQTKIRSDQLDTTEAQGSYDQAVLMLAKRQVSRGDR